MKPIVVLYHAACRDGFGAAWSAWKKFGNRASYIPVEHQAPPPKGLIEKEIYMLDFTYPLPYTKELMKHNRVTAIDHHISAKPVTELTENYSYALDHSGSVLTWKYFHPKKKAPFLLRCVEDSDIWKWKIPKSKEILTYIDLFEHDFKLWNKLARDLEDKKTRNNYIQRGSLLLAYAENLMRELVGNAQKVKFEGYAVYALNAPPFFASELGHALAKKLPPIAIVWRQEKRKIKVSLRSNGKVDVSKIAKRYGGGGHKAAAGFAFEAERKFPWKIIKK